MQKRLDQFQRIEALGALAAGIAHDFNNILFPINGYAEMLINDLPKGSDLWENATGILESGLRAKNLVKQILTITHDDDDNELKSVMPQLIVKETLKLIRSTLPRQIEISQFIDPKCACLMGDPAQIRQVVMNLATNAYHAMENIGGRLSVVLKNVDIAPGDKRFLQLAPGPHILLSVTDTGSGMDPETLNRVFDPQFTTKPQNKGTGFGLAVVRSIVDRHEGEIIVESDVGKGSAIDIYFPSATKNEKTTATAQSYPPPLHNLRVLFVDDEKAIIKAGTHMLKRLGHAVESYSCSLSALKAFNRAPDSIDIIITDLSMPHMTGDQLAAAVRKVRPDIPVIICTGYDDEMTAKKVDAEKYSAILRKPVMRAELAAILQNVMIGSDQRGSLE